MQKTAQLKVLPVGVLRPAAYNPRKKLKPGDKEYEKIKNSIMEFGFADPLVVNSDMTIVGGHQRLAVAMELGYTEVPCAVVDVDKVREKALNIALNKNPSSASSPSDRVCSFMGHHCGFSPFADASTLSSQQSISCTQIPIVLQTQYTPMVFILSFIFITLLSLCPSSVGAGMAAIFPLSSILPACQKWFPTLWADSRPGGFPIFRVRVSILPRIPAGF